MIIFHQQVFHNCEMSKGCCVFKILSSVFAKTVQESFENATGFVRNVHFLQFVLPSDFYNCAKKFWNCHRVCRWDESALKALQGVKWPDAIYNSFCLFLETHTIYISMGWGGTFVCVKFDCTNIFGHSFVSVKTVWIFEYIQIFVQFSIQISIWTFVLVNTKNCYKCHTLVYLWSTSGLDWHRSP